MTKHDRFDTFANVVSYGLILLAVALLVGGITSALRRLPPELDMARLAYRFAVAVAHHDTRSTWKMATHDQDTGLPIASMTKQQLDDVVRSAPLALPTNGSARVLIPADMRNVRYVELGAVGIDHRDLTMTHLTARVGIHAGKIVSMEVY